VPGFVTGVGRRVQEAGKRKGYGGMANNRFYPPYLFFVITGVYGGTRACGQHRDRCGDRQKDQEVVFVFF